MKGIKNPARGPPRHAQATLLRSEQQQRTGRSAQEATPRSTRSPITCRQEARPRRVRRIPRQERPRAGKTIFARRAAWDLPLGPSLEKGGDPLPTRRCQTPTYKPGPSALFDPAGFPSRFRDYAGPITARTSRTSRQFQSQDRGTVDVQWTRPPSRTIPEHDAQR